MFLKGAAAATFFFSHEHVVSTAKIVQIGGGVGTLAYYDLIDSLPTLNLGGRRLATQIRHEGIEAFAMLFLWYTSRKFTDANCTFALIAMCAMIPWPILIPTSFKTSCGAFAATTTTMATVANNSVSSIVQPEPFFFRPLSGKTQINVHSERLL